MNTSNQSGTTQFVTTDPYVPVRPRVIFVWTHVVRKKILLILAVQPGSNGIVYGSRRGDIEWEDYGKKW